MSVVTIEKAGEHEGQEVTLQGWLYNLRESGKLLFPIFRDGTGLMQGVVSQKEQPDAFAALRGLTQESSVEITGKIRREPRAVAGQDQAVKFFDRPAVVDEPGGQIIEQFGMSRLVAHHAEVAGSPHQPFAEMRLPNAIDDHARRQRVLRIGEPLR